jgi:D-3-phosphoglycerate dehydrogenase / 2-oxoglutarate reductase
LYCKGEASSQSVAELVFAHAIGAARFLHQANRNMPAKGESEFKTLKKAYGAGIELKDKTIGIVGFGRIGRAVGRIAVGLGMKVLAHDPYLDEATLRLDFHGSTKSIQVLVKTGTMRSALEGSDIVTLHVPLQGRPVIGEKELKCMKPDAILINASRGGIIDEKALIEALDNGVILVFRAPLKMTNFKIVTP